MKRAVAQDIMTEKQAVGLGLPGSVPIRCQRAPNATFDRSFALYTCNQRDAGCPFHGPVFVLDGDGRRYECRKMESAS